MTIDQEIIENLIQKLLLIVEDIDKTEEKYQADLELVHPEYRKSAKNLLHYLAFRQHDMREIRQTLGMLGVTKMTNSEANVMPVLRSVLRLLYRFAEGKKLKIKDKSKKFIEAIDTFERNTEDLLGPVRDDRQTRIMVTLPTEAAYNYSLVEDLIKAGANSLRINCAHDDENIWARMIQNIIEARKKTGLYCRVNMDLSGPKLRTGPILPGSEIIRIRPVKNTLGQIEKPAECWMGLNYKTDPTTIPVNNELIENASVGDIVRLRDTRDKKRKFLVIEKQNYAIRISTTSTIYMVSGLPLSLEDSFGELKLKGKIGQIPAVEETIFLKTGEVLELHKDPEPGESVRLNEDGTVDRNAHLSCTLEEVFNDLKKGDRVLFDDGKIESKIISISKKGIKTRITYAGLKGTRLKADKGINLPDSTLTISGLTQKDKSDLKFVATNADAVNMSFVNGAEDVSDLLSSLKSAGNEEIGTILKIETQQGYQNLPGILLRAMQSYPVGVMIARGDLAVECGWQNLAEIQEEIMRICKAARIPDVWATQVLETLAKKGRPSRAEITDAAMAQRADCIMLNKGPYILEAVKLLDQIIRKMDRHQEQHKLLMPEVTVTEKLEEEKKSLS